MQAELRSAEASRRLGALDLRGSERWGGDSPRSKAADASGWNRMSEEVYQGSAWAREWHFV